jgi:hypothetical protein
MLNLKGLVYVIYFNKLASSHSSIVTPVRNKMTIDS